mgnify:FL=1
MPIYEYQCEQCGHKLEKLQKISDEPLKTCPQCGNQSLKKLVSAAAFRLKGGGWYETDFKTGDKKNVTGSTDNKSGGSEKIEGTAKNSGEASKSGAPEKKNTSSAATEKK